MDSKLNIVVSAVTEAAIAAVDELNGVLKDLAGQADEVSAQASASLDKIDASAKVMADGVTSSSLAASEALKGMAADAEATTAKVAESADASAAAVEDSGKKMGLGAAGLAVGIGAVFALSIKDAADFQKSLTQVYSSAGETAPLKTMQQGILSISEATGTSTAQLTAGLYNVSSAGYNAASGLDIVKAAAEGAKAENADMGTVTDALTTIMVDYHKPASDAASVTNQMIAAVSAGKMHLQDFSSSLSTVLPIADQVGLSFAQVAGAEATLTAGGVSANQATQDLKAVIQGLQNPNQTQIAEMQQLGLNSTQLAQNIGKQGLTGTIQEVSDAIMKNMGPAGTVLLNTMQNSTQATADAKQEIAALPSNLKSLAQSYADGKISTDAWNVSLLSLDPTQKHLLTQFASTENKANSFNKQLASGSPAAQTYAQALDKVYGRTDAVSAVMGLSGSNATKFAANVKNIGDASKTTGGNISSWKDIQGTFAQQMSQLDKTIEAMGISLGTALLPPLTKAAKGMIDIIKPIADLIKNNPKVAATILIVVAAIAALIAIAFGAAKALLGIKKAFTDIGEGYKTLSTAMGKGFDFAKMIAGFIKTGATAVWSAITATASFVWGAITTTAAWVLANAAMIVGVLLLVAIVAAVVVEIIKHWNDVKKWIGDFVGWIKDIFKAAMKIVGDIFGGLSTAIKVVFDVIATIVKVYVDIYIAIFKLIADFFVLLWNGIVDLIKLIFDGIKAFFTAEIDGWKDIFHVVVDIFTDVFKGAWNGMVAIWNGITGFFLGLWNGVKNAITGVGDIFSGVWDAVKSGFKTTIDWVIDGVNTIINGVNTVTGKIPGIGGHLKIPDIPQLATGTPFWPGGVALVGEHGPEMVNLPSGASVTPNTQTMQALSGGAGGGVNINIQSQAFMGSQADAQVFAQTVWQNLQKISRQYGLQNNMPNIGIRPM